MRQVFFSVTMALFVMPLGAEFGTDAPAAGPCNPEVQDCP